MDEVQALTYKDIVQANKWTIESNGKNALMKLIIATRVPYPLASKLRKGG
jgi:hypothetical protein